MVAYCAPSVRLAGRCFSPDFSTRQKKERQDEKNVSVRGSPDGLCKFGGAWRGLSKFLLSVRQMLYGQGALLPDGRGKGMLPKGAEMLYGSCALLRKDRQMRESEYRIARDGALTAEKVMRYFAADFSRGSK